MTQIIDFHNHLGEDLAEDYSQSADELLARMDAAGIEKAVIFAFDGSPNIDRDNQVVLEAARTHPDRFIPFWVVMPTIPKPQRAQIPARLRELASGVTAIKGIVLAPTMHTYRLTHPLILEICETCTSLHMPVIIHYAAQWSEETASMRELAGLAPATTFIVPAPTWNPNTLAILKESSNVYFDTSKSYGWLTFRPMLHEVGTERILFGTETPKMNPALEIAKIREFEFTDEQRQQILYGNAARLLGM